VDKKKSISTRGSNSFSAAEVRAHLRLMALIRGGASLHDVRKIAGYAEVTAVERKFLAMRVQCEEGERRLAEKRRA